MSAVTFLIGEKTRQFEAECSRARGLVSLARTIQDVVRASRVHEPSLTRGMGLNSSGKIQLARAAERMLDGLLPSQLLALGNTTSPDACKAMLGQLMCGDWNYLRGAFPSHYRKADRDGHKILFLKQRGDTNGLQGTDGDAEGIEPSQLDEDAGALPLPSVHAAPRERG